MRMIVATTYPDMKKEPRRKAWKELNKRANDFSRDDDQAPVTLEQIARRMAGKLQNG